jgi:hypothetical protein
MEYKKMLFSSTNQPTYIQSLPQLLGVGWNPKKICWDIVYKKYVGLSIHPHVQKGTWN